MKKLQIIVLLLCTILASCTKQTQQEIQTLKTEKVELQNQTEILNARINLLKSTKSKLEEEVKVLNIYKEGKKPKYILKLRLKQTHFTLDLEQHAKDALNTIEFEIPVDEDFYNKVSKGTDIVDEFRWGSLLLYGSFGDWDMQVMDKKILK